MRFHSIIAKFVVATMLLMLSAIQFGDESRFQTCKISDIAADRNLAAETIPANLTAP